MLTIENHSRNVARDQMIKDMAEQGRTYKEIGDKVGVKGQRVKQIIDRYGIERPADVRRRERNTVAVEERRKKKGLDSLIRDDFYYATRKKFMSKRSSAEQRGIEFSLHYGDVVFPTHCPILGVELNYFSDVISNNSPSFDRIDPKKGYTKDNTMICCFLANRIKTDATKEDIYNVWRYMESFNECNK